MGYLKIKINSYCILLLLINFFAWSSCSDKDETSQNFPTPHLSFENEIWTIPMQEGENRIAINSNLPWRIKTNNNWITLTNKNGLGNDSIVINVTENNQPDAREGIITAWITDTYIKELRIIQLGIGKQMIPSNTELSFLSKGGDQQIAVISNVEWEISETPNWLTATKENDKVNIHVDKNLSDQVLTGSIVLKEKNGEMTSSILVSQASIGDLLVFSKHELKIGNDGGNLNVELTTNVEYTCSASADWIHIIRQPGATSGQVKSLIIDLQIDPVTDVSSRVGYLYIKSSEADPDTLKITQGQISVIASAFDSKVVFDIESDKGLNISFTNPKPEWIGNVTPQPSENGKQKIEIELEYNSLSMSREASFVVSDGVSTWPMKIIQNPSDSETDRAALNAFYEEAGGKNWIKSWNLDAPMETNDTNWPFVTFENGRVIGISMISENGITGNLSALCNLLELKKLQFKHQQIAAIPNEIGRLHKLMSFWLIESGAEGTIPTSIEACKSLTEINLSNHPTATPAGFANSFSGSIQSFIKLPNLVTIKIYCNNFNGSLPTIPLKNGVPTTWLNLKEFLVYSNAFTGSIPFGYGTNIGKSTNNGLFFVNDNQLSGIVPEDIKAMSRYATDRETRILKGNNLTE